MTGKLIKQIAEGEIVIKGVPNTLVKTIRIEKLYNVTTMQPLNGSNPSHKPRFVFRATINGPLSKRLIEQLGIEFPKVQIQEGKDIHTFSQVTIAIDQLSGQITMYATHFRDSNKFIF